MNEKEARDRCAELAAEHPDRFTHQWVATKRGDEWLVAKIGIPPVDEAMTTEIHAAARPEAEDPRNQPPWLNPPSGGIA